MFSRAHVILGDWRQIGDNKTEIDSVENLFLGENVAENSKEIRWHHFACPDDYSDSLLGDEEGIQEKKSVSLDDILYTEEEIHQYLQLLESTAPLNLETKFEISESVKEKNGLRLVKKR